MIRLARVAFVAALLAPAARPAIAQRADSVELNRARALIVLITGPPRFDYGAGIVVGVTRDLVYIATARHVLLSLRKPDSVRVTFLGDTTTVAALVAPGSYNGPEVDPYDVGLISVSRAALASKGIQIDAAWQQLDRLADTKRVRIGDPVFSVGCPKASCWELPVDESVYGVGEHLRFMTQFVAPGNSGGALLSQWGEVIGMVVQSDPPFGRALSIDVVLERVRAWNASVSLRRPSVPRWPYNVELRASWLGSAGIVQGQSALGGLDIGLSKHLGWHLNVLRLSPENLAITALVAGASLRLRRGRFTLAPFADFGLSHADARRDLGGYYVGVGAEQAYVPAWSETTIFGFGGGGGISTSIIVAPRFSLELTGARWSFQRPPDAPQLPDFYVGGGIRWAIR